MKAAQAIEVNTESKEDKKENSLCVCNMCVLYLPSVTTFPDVTYLNDTNVAQTGAPKRA